MAALLAPPSRLERARVLVTGGKPACEPTALRSSEADCSKSWETKGKLSNCSAPARCSASAAGGVSAANDLLLLACLREEPAGWLNCAGPEVHLVIEMGSSCEHEGERVQPCCSEAPWLRPPVWLAALAFVALVFEALVFEADEGKSGSLRLLPMRRCGASFASSPWLSE